MKREQNAANSLNPCNSGEGCYISCMVVTPRHKKLAEELEKVSDGEQTLQGALISAGYSPSTAKMGWTGVPKVAMSLLTKRGAKLTRFGAELSLDDCKNLVLGRLAENCVKGKDGGVMSAKVLGSRRELNLWTPDSQVGVIVLSQGSRNDVQTMLEPPADLPEVKK